MASITATAFKWTGTYYNATYTTSYSVTISDDDDQYEGGGDSSEMVSINGSTESASMASPFAIDVSFTDTSGAPHVETFYFFNTAGDWYFIPSGDSEFTEGAHLGNYQSHVVGWEYDAAVCFTNGTRIETVTGPILVEDLKPGTLVRVLDGGYRPLRKQLVRDFGLAELADNPHLHPVSIDKGALGSGLPWRKLCVSRQHRMLINGPICQRMFETQSVLVPAHRLAGLPGCWIEAPDQPLSYHHLVFDQHEIVFAEGAASESFFPGPEAMKSVGPAARAELCAIYPELDNDAFRRETAHRVPSAAQQRKLLARHHKNEKPLYCPDSTLANNPVTEATLG